MIFPAASSDGHIVSILEEISRIRTGYTFSLDGCVELGSLDHHLFPDILFCPFPEPTSYINE